MDCSLQGSSVHGPFQARGLQWVAISFFLFISLYKNWHLKLSLTFDSCVFLEQGRRIYLFNPEISLVGRETNTFSVSVRCMFIPSVVSHLWLLFSCKSCLILCDPVDCSPPASSVHGISLAWRIPWTEEPVGLQSTGSQGVWCNWALSV